MTKKYHVHFITENKVEIRDERRSDYVLVRPTKSVIKKLKGKKHREIVNNVYEIEGVDMLLETEGKWGGLLFGEELMNKIGPSKLKGKMRRDYSRSRYTEISDNIGFSSLTFDDIVV